MSLFCVTQENYYVMSKPFSVQFCNIIEVYFRFWAQDGRRDNSVLSEGLYDFRVWRASIEIDSSYLLIHFGIRDKSSILALWQKADNLPVSSPVKFHPQIHGQFFAFFHSFTWKHITDVSVMKYFLEFRRYFWWFR